MCSSAIMLRSLAIVTICLVYRGCAASVEILNEIHSEPEPCKVRLGSEASGEGVRNRTFNGVSFCEYLGIRYAKAPIGELRFANPVPNDPEGHRNNYTAYGSKCVQFQDINKQKAVIGDEDCLFLNIFTPGNVSGSGNTSALPVLVFIHGGSNVAGSGEVDGVDLLMENDVIVVTLNYRLGVLGFLKNERHNITGNYGLKDQLAALRWIQRHVHHFGGDPGRVTLMGHSAGASSVTHHLYHGPARGLFHGAIVLSGSMLAPWALLYDHEKCVDNYLRDLSATTLEELREQPARDFMLRDSRMRYLFAFASMFYMCFIPTLEDHPDTMDGAYFTRSPHEAVRTGTPHPMPLLVSETSTEFELILPHVFDFWMSENFVNNRQPEIKRQIADLLENLSHWAVAQELEDSRASFYRKLANMANLRYPIKRFIEELDEQQHEQQLYYLRFQFDGKFGQYKKQTFAWYVDDSVYGAIHGDELGYIFNSYNFAEALANRSEFRSELSVHIKTVELIANFVKYGNPTPKRSKLSGVLWPAYSESRNQTQFLNIDEEFTVRDNDDRRNMYYLVWQVIYECLYYSSRCEGVGQLHELVESYADTRVAQDEDFDLDLHERLKDYRP